MHCFLRNLPRVAYALGGLALATCLLTNHADAQTTYTWGNTGTDWNTAGDWTPTTGYPGSTTSTADVAAFTGTAVTSPNLSASVSIANLEFTNAAASGYTVSSLSNSVTLTLNLFSTTAPTAPNYAIYAANTSGTNTVSAPLVFSATTGTQYVDQQGAGGTLILANTLKASGTTLQFGMTSTGTIVVQGNNGTVGATGSLTANVKLNGGSVALGSGATLGSGSVTFNTTTGLASSDANSRTLPNALGTFGGTTPFYVLGKDPNATANSNVGNGDLIFTSTAAATIGTANPRRFVVYNNTSIAAVLTGGTAGTSSNTAGGFIKTGSGTLTLSGNNTFEGPVTVMGAVTYTSPNGQSLTSLANAGTLSLTGSNAFTGATTINGGILSAGADNALKSTGSIAVTNGGTLLLANTTTNNDRVNNAAGITLGTASTSGTIQKGAGVSEGTSSAVGLGALTLTAGSPASAVDYTSTAGTLTFTSFTPNSATLTISNYVNDGTDHLIFNQDVNVAGFLGNIAFTGYTGDTETALGNGFYEITPMGMVAVPEPATWLCGLASVGLLGFHLRGRMRQRPRLT